MLPYDLDVERCLLEIGASPDYKGYRYLLTAVCLVIEDNELLHHVSGELYPKVAQLCGATASSIEKGIATLIRKINWTDEKLKRLNLRLHGLRGVPTSAKLIAQISRVVVVRRQIISLADGFQKNELAVRNNLFR